jgi:hypothetical protein
MKGKSKGVVSIKKETKPSSASKRKKNQHLKIKPTQSSSRISIKSQRHAQEQEDSGSDEIDPDYAEFLKTYVPEEDLCDSDHDNSFVTVEDSIKPAHVRGKNLKSSSSKMK